MLQYTQQLSKYPKFNLGQVKHISESLNSY